MILAAEGNKKVEGRRPERKVESNRLKSELTLQKCVILNFYQSFVIPCAIVYMNAKTSVVQGIAKHVCLFVFNKSNLSNEVFPMTLNFHLCEGISLITRTKSIHFIVGKS